MSEPATRIVARSALFLCGLLSLLNAAPYALLRGVDIPVEGEWVIFVAALGLVGFFGLATAVLPRSWIARLCGKDRDDPRLFSVPLKLLGGFAAAFYLVAVVSYFAPHTWNLNPQFMLALCPMYFLKMTIDPSPVWIFFILSPINAGAWGAFGATLGCSFLVLGQRRS
jgi:hypothetical protein